MLKVIFSLKKPNPIIILNIILEKSKGITFTASELFKPSTVKYWANNPKIDNKIVKIISLNTSFGLLKIKGNDKYKCWICNKSCRNKSHLDYHNTTNKHKNMEHYLFIHYHSPPVD